MSACEVVQLDPQGQTYGVCSSSCSAEPSWVIFTGETAGVRAYAYATAHYDDVRTGRLRLPSRFAPPPSGALERKAG